METYRYQVKNLTDFVKFISWLVENRINFATQHDYEPSGNKHTYHVTIRYEKTDENFAVRLGNFLDKEIGVIRSHCMTEGYASPMDAANDLYADPYSLHRELDGLVKDFNENVGGMKDDIASMKEQVEKLNEDKEFYRERFYKTLKEKNRVRAQIQSIAVLIDSIFPKD